MNEDIILKDSGGIAAYSEFRAQLATLATENSALVFDYADEKGNKDARSHIHKLRRTKGAVESARKAEKQASLDYGRRVDSEAKEIIEKIEGMIEVHERPIKEIEEREAARKQSIINRLGALCSFLELPDTLSSAELLERRAELDAFVIDESFDESMAAATKHRKDGLAHLDAAIVAATKREAEAAELVRLRTEEIARQQAEREQRIAEEAAAKAKAEAEAAAERGRIASEAATKREQEAAAAREKAERDRADKAVADAKAAEERAARAAQEAVDRERREMVAKAKAEQEAAEKRENDRAHRMAINSAAADALLDGAPFLDREKAEAIVTLIAKKMIPAISIAY